MVHLHLSRGVPTSMYVRTDDLVHLLRDYVPPPRANAPWPGGSAGLLDTDDTP